MGDGLDVDDLVADAIASTGIDDVGDDWFLTPLSAWSTDLRQANLTDVGRRFFRSQAVKDIARRLRVLDTLRAHPEIHDVELPPIVYITGMERSGTTLLHNLIALHDGARSILRWELMEPVPPPEAATAATDPRIAKVQAAIEPLRGSLLEQMHWVDADDPEECVWGFLDCVSFLGQAAGFVMPTWGAFVSQADQTRSFEHYRQLLQLLTWKHPVPDGGFLALKAPQIAVHIAEFATVFPEATFVVPDRDPFRCIVSMVFMGRSIVEPFCVDNPVRGPADEGYADGLHTGAFDVVGSFARKLDALAAFENAHPDRIVHVPYPALIGDPAGTTTRLMDALGVPTDPQLGQRVDDFLAEQRAGRRAAPPAELDTLGFDHDEVLAEHSIARYCARYAITPERSRLTG